MIFNKKAFTLIEVLVSILITSMVLISGFHAYSMVLAGKVKLVERTKLEKETLFFTERLFQTIKEGGTIDYEEYFNRKVVGNETQSGHYKENSGFGNFGNGGNPGESGSANYGDWFYYCRSGDGFEMTATGGCFDNEKLNSYKTGLNTTGKNYSGEPQRYGQYRYQFYDFNYNANDDYGDMDSDGFIIGDDDDREIGNGPIVFTGGVDIKELYLISGDKKRRTLFRYNVKEDPDKIPSANCDFSDGIGTGTGCLGNIQFLILNGKDYGLDHNSSSNDIGENDGIIDTWLVDKRFFGDLNEVAGKNDTESYRKNLFPSTMNVSNFKIYAYPNKNQKMTWSDLGEKKISPYVILSMELKPSRYIKKRIKGRINPIKINTTINLTEIFSK